MIPMFSRLLDVSLSPDASKLPGGGTLMDLTNGLAAWSLILALGAMVVGAGAWALGSATSNVSWADRGKSATIIAALAALLIGGAAAIINFFFSAGAHLH
jgi:Family of unknown function (DUF6112)